VTRVSSNTPAVLDDTGNANPDFDFRYDATINGYVFNLGTKGYASGNLQPELHRRFRSHVVLGPVRSQVKLFRRDRRKNISRRVNDRKRTPRSVDTNGNSNELWKSVRRERRDKIPTRRTEHGYGRRF